MMHRYIFLALLVGVLTACSGSTVQATEPGQQEVATDAVASRTSVATDFGIVTHTPKPTVTQVAVEPTAAPTDVPPTEASDTQTLADGSVLTFVDGVPTKVERDGKAYAFTNEFVDYGTGWQYWNGKEVIPVPVPVDVQAILSADIADLEPADKDVRPVLEKARMQLDETGQLRFVLGSDLKDTPIAVFKDGQWKTELELVADRGMIDKFRWDTKIKDLWFRGKNYTHFSEIRLGGVRVGAHGPINSLIFIKEEAGWSYMVVEIEKVFFMYPLDKPTKSSYYDNVNMTLPLSVTDATHIVSGFYTYNNSVDWTVQTSIVAPDSYQDGAKGWLFEVERALIATSDPLEIIEKWKNEDMLDITNSLVEGAEVVSIDFSK